MSQEETWKELLGEKKIGRDEKKEQNLRKTAHLNSRRHREGESGSPSNSLEARLASLKQTFSAPSSPSSPVKNENKPSSQHSTPK